MRARCAREEEKVSCGPSIGLLPLYLALYDETHPSLRNEFDPFIDEIADRFRNWSIDVVRAETCRVDAEVRAAVRRFDEAGVDLIVTLHLAYSPSLEAAAALVSARQPILMLDTTMDPAFGQDVHPDRIMFNHGIHGVQDLASVLRRNGKPFEIVAGHVSESPVMDRAAGIARAAHAARLLRSTRALRVGKPFDGMGDFRVDETVLHDVLGISVDTVPPETLADWVERVDKSRIDEEVRRDRERFVVDAPDDVHRRSVRVGLGLRALLEDGEYSAFSMNFLAFDSAEGPVDTAPFLEASKAMGAGLGYGGEGDVLSAALVGALNRAFGRTMFTEIFCPDWADGALYLSHMGEINPEVAAEKPHLREVDFPWTGARNPAILTCAPAPGPAVLVNLAPGPGDTFAVIVAPVEVLGDASNPAMHERVRGWIRPACPVEQFLETYSRCGGTHHSALVLGDHAEAIVAFTRFAGLDSTVIGG